MPLVILAIGILVLFFLIVRVKLNSSWPSWSSPVSSAWPKECYRQADPDY